ncbi:hypothetical protein [Dysgonomonas capnocytophagoides]|nr:hypothetical protein [Dysgonomonas capnocytophagoides]
MELNNLACLSNQELADISGGNAYELGRNFAKASIGAAFIIALLW